MSSRSSAAGEGDSGLEAVLQISEEVTRGLPVSVQFTLANRTDEELLVLAACRRGDLGFPSSGPVQRPS